jgi:lactate dehydrogenase-like 2-hydroxyacid dehydrogenase
VSFRRFRELLTGSEFVVITAHLRPDNRHLIDAPAIAKMRSRSYLANISQGSLVDGRAVAEAIEAGRLAG